MAERRTIAWLATALCASCGGGNGDGPASTSVTWFHEGAAQRGIDFVHASGHRKGAFLFPELMGGGAALFDADGDGDLDAFLVQSGGLHPGDARGGHRLYLGDGEGSFRAAPEAGVTTDGYGMGVATGDADGDGDVDLYVTQLGPNALLLNRGDGTFVDGTAAAGVGDERWGTSACFFDYDADGDLDLFVTNYVDWSLETEQDCHDPTGQPDYCSPVAYSAPARDTLYRNDGGGAFTDVTEALGLSAARGNGLGVVPFDYDGDGDLDLFVANDQTADLLWRNDGVAGFVECGELAGVARDRQGGVRAGMGVDVADVDRDDDLDLLVVHLARETDGFFVNQGKRFVERTHHVGIATADWRYTRFGVGFYDLDNDGWLDIFLANGRVNLMMEPLTEDDPYAEPNLVLHGSSDGTWAPVQNEVGTGLLATSRGAAFGDVDGDGAIDVLVVNRDGPAHLLIGSPVDAGNWLIARVVEDGSDALGAQVRFEANGSSLRRDVKSAGSYCSASDPRVHVGLGAVDQVERVHVRWVDGATETFGPFEANQTVLLERGAGR